MKHKTWISQYRDELKGIAMLWVIFFHALIPCGGILGDIQKIGYGGVDIFFFLTGYGLTHSLSRSGNLRDYWHRRMRRILPAYLPLILCWLAVMLPGYGLSTVQAIRSAVGNVLLLGYWLQVPKMFNWYGSALLLFLCLAPLVHGLLSKSEKPMRTLLWMLALVGLAGLCCVGLDQYMAISRLPVFILGMAFAMDWGDQSRISPMLKRIAYGLSFALGLSLVLLCHARYPELLLDYGMYWHPFVLMTPPLCVFLAFLFHKAEKARAVFAPLRWMGRASFEIYLMNIWLVELGKKYALTGGLEWAMLSLGCIALGFGYQALVGASLKACLARKAAVSTSVK
jgi:peptidoglycan/LPS O-acetylase OafA/YrhL